MPLKQRINLKLFIVTSALVNIAVHFLANSREEHIVFLGIYCASILSFILLYLGGLELKRIALASNDEKIDKQKVVIFFIGKLLILFLALSFGVHFIGNRIIIPLINYVIHIFILALSLRNREN